MNTGRRERHACHGTTLCGGHRPRRVGPLHSNDKSHGLAETGGADWRRRFADDQLRPDRSGRRIHRLRRPGAQPGPRRGLGCAVRLDSSVGLARATSRVRRSGSPGFSRPLSLRSRSPFRVLPASSGGTWRSPSESQACARSFSRCTRLGERSSRGADGWSRFCSRWRPRPSFPLSSTHGGWPRLRDAGFRLRTLSRTACTTGRRWPRWRSLSSCSRCSQPCARRAGESRRSARRSQREPGRSRACSPPRGAGERRTCVGVGSPGLGRSHPLRGRLAADARRTFRCRASRRSCGP